MEQNAVKNLNTKQTEKKTYSIEEQDLVKEMFQTDHEYIKHLFKNEKIFIA